MSHEIKSWNYGSSVNLETLERELLLEYQQVLAQEELRNQKSRLEWVVDVAIQNLFIQNLFTFRLLFAGIRTKVHSL